MTSLCIYIWLYTDAHAKNIFRTTHACAYPNLGCHAIIDMIAQEQDRPIIVSKVKYLGSCLLPSPIELEATIVLYYNRMHIPELDATIPIDTVSQIELAKGKDLPSQTIMMLGVVGVVVEKENPYMTIKIVNSPDSLLFKFGNMILADKLVTQIKKFSKFHLNIGLSFQKLFILDMR